jgi:hypothetical protein
MIELHIRRHTPGWPEPLPCFATLLHSQISKVVQTAAKASGMPA